MEAIHSGPRNGWLFSFHGMRDGNADGTGCLCSIVLSKIFPCLRKRIPTAADAWMAAKEIGDSESPAIEARATQVIRHACLSRTRTLDPTPCPGRASTSAMNQSITTGGAACMPSHARVRHAVLLDPGRLQNVLPIAEA